MSRDLIDQLAEYGDQVRTAQRPIELTDVVRDNPGPLEVTMTDAADRPTSQKNWWLIGSAAAATLAIVVAGAVVLTGGDDGPDDELVTGDSSVEVTAPETLPPVESTVDAPPPDSVGDDQPVIPADALEEPTGDVIGPTGTTPLPDFENAVDGDDGAPRRPLGAVEELPESARLDFLADVCAAFLDGRCFRDAVFEDATGREVGLIAAGEPFHIRHGFVNEGGQPLSDEFDLAVYVFPMDLEDFSDERSPIGPTQRFTTDYVVRGETDACGPDYESQTGAVTCEWFVHEFPNGLPEGRWAVWTVWEAPCWAWIDLGRAESCSDPDEVMSFFSSGGDSPFGAPPETTADVTADPGPTVTEVGEWTRVEGLGQLSVISDGQSFFGLRWDGVGSELLRSDDGITWSEPTPVPFATFDPSDMAVRDGRLVAVEDGSESVTVHIVDASGELRTQVVDIEVPAAYRPFHRRLGATVNILEDGRIIIHASYWADPLLVSLAALGVAEEDFPSEEETVERDFDLFIIEQLDEPVDEVDGVPSIAADDDALRVRIDGVEREFSFAEFGLDPLWQVSRSLVVVSSDGETWTQVEHDPEISVSQVRGASGGVVGEVTALVFERLNDRGPSFSNDGVHWQPIEGRGWILGGETPHHAFYVRLDESNSVQAIYEITGDGLVLLADEGAASEAQASQQGLRPPLLLTGGDAGIAYLVGDDLETHGLRWTVDGASWVFEPLPVELPGADSLSVGASAILVTAWEGESRSIWVRDVPG